MAVSFEGEAGPVVSPGVPGPPFYRGVGLHGDVEEVAIVVVAWIVSVLVYVEFLKAR